MFDYSDFELDDSTDAIPDKYILMIHKGRGRVRSDCASRHPGVPCGM